METNLMYCLFDACVVAAYYLPKSTRSKQLVKNARNLIESVRSGESQHFFYIPNFCIAEVFSVFMKYAYGQWNSQVKHGTIHGKIHNSLRDQFQKDIHNAKLFYHYELSRYHVLSINLVAPIDHYFKLSRGKGRNKSGVNPAGTFDHLIIAMGLHLAKIHGPENVCIITADDRLEKIVNKCNSGIPSDTKRKLNLSQSHKLTGIDFNKDSFPYVVNLKKPKKKIMKSLFEDWPLPVKNRYKKPYLAK